MPEPLLLNTVEDLLPKWKKFKQQFQVFLAAAGFERLSETRKAAILLNCIGQEAQDLYYNLLKTDEDYTTVKYDTVIKEFDNYFEPKQNEIINTVNFHRRQQEELETFDSYYADLRKISKNCNFTNMEDRMLRDRIVMGVFDKKLQRKLLEVGDLTLDKALTMCRAAELSKEHVKILQKNTEVTPSVNVIQKQQHPNNQNKAKYNNFTRNRSVNNHKQTQNTKQFYHCLKCDTEHGPRSCPAYGKTCKNCNKMNHLAKCCLNKTINCVSEDIEDPDNNNAVHDL